MNNKKGKIIKPILLGILFFIVLTLPFLHIYYKKLQDWSPYSEHYKKYNIIVKKYEKNKILLLNSLEEGSVEIKEYVQRFKKLDTKKKSDLKSYHRIKKDFKSEYSFLGYSSYRYFLYAIGLPTLALVLSFFTLYLIYNPNTISIYNQFYKMTLLGFVFVSSFWFLRSFLTRTDFPRWAYDLSYVLLALLMTMLIYLLIKIIKHINKIRIERQKDLRDIINDSKELIDIFKTTM